MSKREDFVDLLKSQVDKAIYVWGGDGENVSAKADPAAWIRKCETSNSYLTNSYATMAINLYNKRVKAGVNPIIAVDCSGFIYWALKKLGLRSGDINSRGLYSLCSPIKKGELQAGDLVFKSRSNKAADIHHVGAYIGGGKVAESKGRAYGVVVTNFNGGGWDMYGRLPYFEAEAADTTNTENNKGAGKVYITLDVLKKGHKGKQVEALQALLIAKGFKCGATGVDGEFGKNTEAAVKKYQDSNGLAVDGVVGVNTWSALLGL